MGRLRDNWREKANEVALRDLEERIVLDVWWLAPHLVCLRSHHWHWSVTISTLLLWLRVIRFLNTDAWKVTDSFHQRLQSHAFQLAGGLLSRYGSGWTICYQVPFGGDWGMGDVHLPGDLHIM
ncbi:uncharacterized protein A4U43_C01F28590 [Asparagus officinalis]|uniref:Uncharacterized protein n=1 Tax=Asparagus officinalis TaxID=4686 RepID=A0A5P1FUQ0_ASPOF|nr:uncharacterized protein A4U43_C01F28590 [Asparagus officinalis]